MRQKGPTNSCCAHGTILARGIAKLAGSVMLERPTCSCCSHRTLSCAQRLCAVGKINGSMRSKIITYSYCSSGAIVARRSGKAGKMSWKRATDSCFSHDTPLPKLREDVLGRKDRLSAAFRTVFFFYRGKLLQSDQCTRSETPTSSCIDIALTLSSTTLREREYRRTGTLEKAHL